MDDSYNVDEFTNCMWFVVSFEFIVSDNVNSLPVNSFTLFTPRVSTRG